MKRIAILTIILITLVSNSSDAQWKMLFHDQNASGFATTIIYFIDLPGPPKIGFIGNEQFGLLKTTDGGQTWKRNLTVGPPNGMAFKDSSTGWNADGDGVFKTTDCGETWTELIDTDIEGGNYLGNSNGIYYDTTDGVLIVGGETPNVSLDEGKTWTNPDNGGYEGFTSGFAFNNGDTGVLSSTGIDDVGPVPWYLTTDGGHTWQASPMDSDAWQPLAIPGTTTQFAITFKYGAVLRSDDYWKTWDKLYEFPDRPDRYNEISSGCIRGDTSHLFVQTIDGCFMSTDQGHNWNNLCGIPSPIIGATIFYVKYPYVYLQVVDQIWMLNVDSMQYFASEVNEQFPDGSKRTGVSAGSNVIVNYVPHTDTLVGIDSVMLAIHYDSASLSLTGIKIPSPWSILDSSLRGNELHILITDTAAEPLPSPILQLQFGTFLTSSLSAKVYLDSAHLYGHRLNCDCAVQSILSADTSSLATSIDSVEIDFTGCGDSILLAAMQGKLPLIIGGVIPNPFSQSTQISFTSEQAGYADIYIVNLLGEQVARIFSGELDAGSHSFTFSNALGLPDGTYECLLRMNGRVETLPMVILH